MTEPLAGRRGKRVCAARFRYNDGEALLPNYRFLLRPVCMLLRLSIVLFAVVGLSLFLTGCVYLSLDEFMPYHAEALRMDWSALGPNQQGLILGLLKGLGGGAFVSGLAILIMIATSLRKSPAPFLVLLPLTAICYTALLCYATLTVYLSTPGDPPILLTTLLLVMSVVASLALLLSQRGGSDNDGR